MTDEPTNPTPAEASPTPASDEQSVFAKAVPAANPLSKEQLRSLVDVLSADVRRALKNPIKPKDAELLGRVVDRAAKLAIEIRLTPVNSDPKVLARLMTRKRQVDSQLAGIKSIGSSLAAKRFWALVDAAISRLTSFAVTAAVAAL